MENCKSMLFLIRCIAISIRKISSLKLFSPCTTIQRLLCYNTRRLGKSQYRTAISVIRFRSINLRSSTIAQIGEIGEIGAQSDTVKIELFRFCTFFRTFLSRFRCSEYGSFEYANFLFVFSSSSINPFAVDKFSNLF